MLLKHFQVFFNIAGEKNYLFLFPSKTHKKFASQLQIEQPASRRTTIFYIVHQNGRGKSPQIYPSVGGGGFHLTFSMFPHEARLEMLENIINSYTEPSAVTNFPASSSEHLLFLPASKNPQGNR